jgi:hypothetical protein
LWSRSAAKPVSETFLSTCSSIPQLLLNFWNSWQLPFHLNLEVSILTFHEEMQQLMDKMVVAFGAGDAHSCAQMFAPDGVLYSPYAVLARGRTACIATGLARGLGGSSKLRKPAVPATWDGV